MANSLPGPFEKTTTVELGRSKSFPQHERLNSSSKIINELLIHNYVPAPAHVVQFANIQQLHPHTTLRPIRTKNRHLARRPVSPKKSLNSWMAFRAFYKRAFPSLQQKDASTHLTILWKKDPFKAKWTIVASAYSRIRDMVGKPGAPLHAYLNMVCPVIGLVSAEEYFGTFNWTWEEKLKGAPALRQTSEPDLRGFDHSIVHTTMTEMDVIKFCGVMGYLPMPLAAQLSTSSNMGQAQKGLLAAAPTLPSRPLAAEKNDSTFNAPVDSQDYDWSPQNDWTGSLSDIYNMNETSPDLTHLFQGSTADLWNITNVQDPQPHESFLGNNDMGYGYFDPFDDLRDFNLLCSNVNYQG